MKAEADMLGVLSLLYLKDFCRTNKTEMLNSELNRDYIQELITLRELKNNGMSRGGVIGPIQKLLVHHFKNPNSTGTISGKQSCFQSSIKMAPSKLPRPKKTKRISVKTRKLLRWHGTVDGALEEMDLQNSWYIDWEGIK